MPDVSPEEFKRLEAIARANEVFDAVTRISYLRNFIDLVMSNHDEKHGGHRDCEAFHTRLNDLALGSRIKEELEMLCLK